MEKTKDQHRGKGAMEHDQQYEGGNPSTQGQLGVLLPAGHLFPSWDHVFSARSDTSLQVSFDRYKRDDVLMEHRRTLAIEFKHHFAWSTRQDFVWGASYGPKRGTARFGIVGMERLCEFHRYIVRNSGKAQMVTAFKTSQSKLTSDELSDMKVRVYGSAVITGKADVKGMLGGKDAIDLSSVEAYGCLQGVSPHECKSPEEIAYERGRQSTRTRTRRPDPPARV